MSYKPQKHHRRSIRLKNYDYSQAGSYFLTLCVQDRQHLFGEIRKGVMGLNQFGIIAYEEWMRTLDIRKNISLGAFIIMPNHMHGIIHIDYSLKKNTTTGKFQSPSQTIGAIIRGYKGATTKKIKKILHGTGELQFAPTGRINLNKSIWQRNYYEHIIKNNSTYQNISNYIWNNPQKWTADKFY